MDESASFHDERHEVVDRLHAPTVGAVAAKDAKVLVELVLIRVLRRSALLAMAVGVTLYLRESGRARDTHIHVPHLSVMCV